MNHFLVFYYDGNDNVAALVSAVDRTTVPSYILETADNKDWDVLLVLELHHDYFDADENDWSPELVIDGMPFNIRALPEFGVE